MEVGSKLIEAIAQVYKYSSEPIGATAGASRCADIEPGSGRQKPSNLNCVSPSTCSSQRQNCEMAGAVGFEPTCGGSKVRCLTTWRRPNGSGSPQYRVAPLRRNEERAGAS